jgi:hypothetical protein
VLEILGAMLVYAFGAGIVVLLGWLMSRRDKK